MDLRNPHLKKAHQVGLFKVGVPEGYLVPSGVKWTQVDKSRPKSTQIDPGGHKCIELDSSGPK